MSRQMLCRERALYVGAEVESTGMLCRPVVVRTAFLGQGTDESSGGPSTMQCCNVRADAHSVLHPKVSHRKCIFFSVALPLLVVDVCHKTALVLLHWPKLAKASLFAPSTTSLDRNLDNCRN